ncbi:branched-chain amino acid transport system II carrier protein [Planococcus sp. N028]|uniref:Branched-chain amino acid transport system carrier protein n=1 Tax=Planococcus shixiaomingii TaxID=3058393 RepID=A0ABT8N5M2_9BACL|nr:MULTISPECIES: branched-chain amino acid transport system II carrier protein [unclassified Planococcus (in: firmicutes)]MDN7243180.1 branched-chain amino acid transport system II carrier protein [Planococcus sp. N028]WKA55124.1 branched-chain amino acid transport system II carrier protein [Planococcus sp. N022]
MKNSLKMASAFIGIIVGAGFASGQEILQYFTSFGVMGIIAALIATVLFAYLGMNLTLLGSRMQTTSHKEVVYGISGKTVGRIVDYIIIFTLFGVGVVMIAGAGSLFSQQFGLPAIVGSTLMTILVIVTIMLNVHKVIAIIGSITPFLVITIIVLAVYSLMTMDGTFASLDPIAKEQTSAVSNWFLSAINYVSFNIAVGASMAIVMGSTEKDEKVAARGGLIGGFVLGILIILSHLAIFSKIDVVGGSEMPMLQIANDISPTLGFLMSIILFGMIFNTAVGMVFAFSARFYTFGTVKFRIFVIITSIVSFILSFVGFTKLVSMFYPVVGYLGLFLVGAIILAAVRYNKKTVTA